MPPAAPARIAVLTRVLADASLTDRQPADDFEGTAVPAPIPMPVADRPRAARLTSEPAARATARAGLLRRLLVTDPRGLLPGRTGRIAYQDTDLERLWTTTAQLRPVLAWVGTFDARERLPLLFSAIAAAAATLAPDHRPVLIVCGDEPTDGPATAHPVDLARCHGISESVFVAGRRHHAEMPVLYRAADAFLTTATDTPAALWEAMGCGCPPIALTRTPAELVIVNGGHDANGWIADARPEYLAAAIAQVCIAPPERARRGRAAAALAHRQPR
nr:hypothetical protein KPHV_29390 [Kitasatospora purpeofusca]